MKLLRSCISSTSLRKHWLHISTQRLQNESKQKPADRAWAEPEGVISDVVIYNPLVKRKVPLILRNRGYVTWYMCGPTVYDSAHIGHACSYVRLDVIRRILEDHFDINLVTVMGITDIDDKIIKKSLESKRDWKELTRFYEKEFFADMAALNVQRPYLCSRVSEHLPQIIQFIGQILHNGGAYVSNEGSVYFDTIQYKGYGKFGAKEPGAPIHGKRNGADFALWKAAKPDEPFWESPWGPGRPGWHIECSVMASESVGANVDIHSGGIDLAFPHHENEEAQSCQYHGVEQWVNYWLHTGHLHSKNMKMSKSLGNTISVSELLREYTSDQFRLYILSSHYRTGIDYTDQSMVAPVTITKKFESFIDDCNNYVAGTLPMGNIDDVTLMKGLVETKAAIRTALANDFETPKAIRYLIDLVALGNKMLHSPAEEGKSRSPAAVAATANYVTSTLRSFGLQVNAKNTAQRDIIAAAQTTDVIESFVKFRQDVRNFALQSKSKDKTLLGVCDEARKELSVHGVQIKDHGKESTWSIGGARKISN
ncbi:cysteine--tRNA ligase, mitochondrial isoform X1 [Athalia rosae]|uniref:cysteine--tRNA ligase, mitochondrial isoform X1 n=1 Tax=Athalia rosae TaxID=37344 RepID=UPI00203376EA|nr:cysteine--tRNA ligase, mitochondrial isoform X1 [Athalia rosae]